MTNGIRRSSWFELALYYFGRSKAFSIEGDSMLPTLDDGDKVLVHPRADLIVGDIVLAEHPYRTDVKIVKRISNITIDGRVTLIGDNPAKSTDSRAFGAVSIESIIGKVVSRL